MVVKDTIEFPGTGDRDAARASLLFQEQLQEMQDSISAIEHCKKPVIVGIAGVCIGAGLDMITAADIRLCTKSALFSVRVHNILYRK
jgi:delta(3,5)-delta(2,4)-dienoyl-CoA isomerase